MSIGSPMNRCGALLLECEQAALDRADARGGDVAVVGLQLLRMIADVLQHRAEILEVEQQQAAVVGHLEDERQHARLRLVEIEDARQQQRTEIGDRRADRMTLFAEDVPEDGRACRVGRLGHADELEALEELGRRGAGLRDARQIAFDVGHEHRNADPREALGHHLQRDRLSGAGRAGDEAVAIGERRQEAKLGVAILRNGQRIGHGGSRA